MTIKELGEKYTDYCVSMRRYFHQHPELSRQEVETSKRVKEELDKMGLAWRAIADNGVLCDIGGKKPGKCILLRADMDALQVQEETGFEFASEVPGVMHACGHDSHIAMLLTCAQILKDIQDEINGTVRLCFQPAEEVAWGCITCVEQGALDGVDAVFAIHSWADVDAGKATCQPGPRMAGADMFDVKIHGKGGHGAMPHQGIDAITTTCELVSALQTVISRETSPMEPAVLTVGTIQGGTRWNVLPEYASISGTTRFYSDELRENIPIQMERVAKNVCAAHNCECEFINTRIVRPTINDPEIAEIATGSIKKIFGENGNQNFGLVTGGEDFSEMLSRRPGAVAFVGMRNEATGGTYPNHHGKFKIDEPSMCKGAALYAQVAMDYLNK